MLGISGFEFMLIVVLAFVVIGPERMPEYAQKLKELVKWVRGFALTAREDLKETLGDNPLGDTDWRQYDPRQYDPRVIVREALAEDDAERAAAAEQARLEAEGKTPVDTSENLNRLPYGAYAPFDVEAT